MIQKRRSRTHEDTHHSVTPKRYDLRAPETHRRGEDVLAAAAESLLRPAGDDNCVGTRKKFVLVAK